MSVLYERRPAISPQEAIAIGQSLAEGFSAFSPYARLKRMAEENQAKQVIQDQVYNLISNIPDENKRTAFIEKNRKLLGSLGVQVPEREIVVEKQYNPPKLSEEQAGDLFQKTLRERNIPEGPFMGAGNFLSARGSTPLFEGGNFVIPPPDYERARRENEIRQRPEIYKNIFSQTKPTETGVGVGKFKNIELNMPYLYQEASPEIKEKLGLKKELRVRNIDLKNAGFDIDKLIQRSAGSNMLAASVGVPIKDIMSLGLDPSTATQDVYFKAMSAKINNEKFYESKKQFNLVQDRIRDLFGESMSKQASSALSQIELRLNDPKTSEEEKNLLLPTLNNLAQIANEPLFKKMSRNSIISNIVRTLSLGGIDPQEIKRLVSQIQPEEFKKLRDKKTRNIRTWNVTMGRFED